MDPPSLPPVDLSYYQDIPFGTAIKEEAFYLQPKTTFLNHGSYGAVPQ